MQAPDLAYLLRGERAPQRFAVGATLAVLGVTWPFLLGYAVAVARGSFRRDRTPPDVTAWAPIVRDGALAASIVLAAGAPVAVVATLVQWSGTVAVDGPTLAVALVGLCSAYALPGALARFAHRGTLVAGLDCWTLLDVILLRTYARTWFGLAIVSAVLIASGVALAATVEGTGLIGVWILTALAGYAVVVLGARSVGRTYARIMRLEPDASGGARRSSVEDTP